MKFAPTVPLLAAALLCVAPAAHAGPVGDAPGDATDPAGEITRVTAGRAGDALTVAVAGATDAPVTQLLLDADGDPATGFALDGFGADAMVEGVTVYRHYGAASDWDWKQVGTARRAVEGDTATYHFDAPAGEAAKLRLAVRTLSAAYAPLDRCPDAGSMPFTAGAADAGAADADSSAATRPAAGASPTPAAVQMAAPKADRALPARQRFARAKNFYTYYGGGRVAELSHYDVAVLHTPQMTPAEVGRLTDLGVVAVGYISVGEDDVLRDGDGTGPGGKANWYFDRDADGQPDKNGNWNSHFADAADPKWRADRVETATRMVEEYGFDGIFLDTIDTAQLYPDSAAGMTQLIRELREAMPDKVIVLNQGWAVLPDVAQYGDGIMLESFTATWDFENKSYVMNLPQSLDYHTRRVDGLLNPVRKVHPLKVLVLDYAAKDDLASQQTAADRAATFGFLFAASPIFLDDVYPPIVGTPDPKWLELLATPESMSYTLGEPANGFPAGSKLVPSGTFAGYTVAPLVDGVADRASLPWNRSSWASGEDGEAASLEIRLPEERTGGTLVIDWNGEDGLTPSRAFRVESAQGDGEWSVVNRVEDNDARRSAVALPGRPYDRLRVVQEPGDGSDQRPNLMWVSQVRLDD